ncbi:LuxR C-terminal-related transcriptional regulator [Nocardia alba]|uniref:DNA-binding NarL/FixJ family response regulator n=1 Tax=Nocardia alba TaxID=225051 RepID=A0A4V2PB73_9NOCA|nr:LuxR C-terminal-related transcriptional regulator [Nocardia alba]TCJ96325.1 DNA-binding NarL/FixJ family response regulator [Nocardia alba]
MSQNHQVSVDARDARRVGVVDDQREFTVSALRSYLNAYPDIVIVAAAESVTELLSVTNDVDLVVLDLLLGDGSTPYDNVSALQEQGIESLLFTSGEEAELVRMGARAGARGMVKKSDPPEIVVAAIRAAAYGESVVSTDLAMVLDADPDFAPTLSPRLQRVLALYASGESEKDIAEIMELSPHTVKAYLVKVRSAYAAVGHENMSRSELTRAARLGGFARRPWYRPRWRL